MGTRLTKKAKETFESIKRIDEEGNEWWSSRELAKVLTYADYRRFLDVMRKAWTACQQAGYDPNDHFVIYAEMVSIGSNTERQIDTVKMSRLACYLSVQNADPSKVIVAQAQVYFAQLVRAAEKLLESAFTEEDEKRLILRGEMKKHNQKLASAASKKTEPAQRRRRMKRHNLQSRLSCILPRTIVAEIFASVANFGYIRILKPKTWLAAY